MKAVRNKVLLYGLALVIIAFAIWGPEAFGRYQDKKILGKIHDQGVEGSSEGYRYTLSPNEKLYILSACLNSQTVAESEQSAWTREEDAESSYGNLEGNYAFIRNRKGTSGQQIGEDTLFDTCNAQLEELKKLEILPQNIRAVGPEAYEAEIYSAIDVLEPGNNVAVWKLGLSENRKDLDKTNRLMDAYIDADDGKIYEFYARTSLSWEEIDTDEMISRYARYLGLGKPSAHESDNPLLEATPYYRKYEFSGMGGENTIVTIGFYEGINELFLKISK